MNLSLKKTILFYTILLFLVWTFIELISWGAYRFRYGKISAAQNERDEIAVEYSHHLDSKNIQDRGKKKNWNVIHPYLGFVTEGIDHSRECPDQGPCDRRLRTYEDLPFAASTDENLIVAIIGGSFASGVSYGGGPGYLESQLKKIPRFSNRKIILYHLAAGGYKQPQQLLQINYFLSMGAEFDIIINIDGFNEVALPGVENLSKGVNPVFPRNWYYYVDASLNPQLLALYGRRENYILARLRWAQFFSNPAAAFLPSANLLWKFRNLRLTNKIKLADVALVEYHESGEQKLQYATTGPDYHFSSWDEFYQDMAEVWARSSLQLHDLCRGRGIEYFHFLQPNQYVPGSKPMTEEERKKALSSVSMYGKAAGEGYPFLIRQGKWLQNKGVSFHDLTMMFSDNPKLLYIDDCCHLNMPGYGLVVQEITRTIGKHVAGFQ